VIEEGAAGNGRVGRAAMMLGFAGLLPQIASVGVLALVPSVTTWNWVVPVAVAAIVAVVYPLLILSFLGGIWWGLAMRRGAKQDRLVAIAVLPSLVALVLAGIMLVTGRIGWPLVAIGSVIALTLIVDRHIVAVGHAPTGWMRLRVPLSLGLGGLTIVAGMLAGSAGLPA
jgi:hypothetical protein